MDNMEPKKKHGLRFRGSRKYDIEKREFEEASTHSTDDDVENFMEMCKGMTLATAYAANVGGIATLTGTSTNTVMKTHLDE